MSCITQDLPHHWLDFNLKHLANWNNLHNFTMEQLDLILLLISDVFCVTRV